jgi:hypothetical protein
LEKTVPILKRLGRNRIANKINREIEQYYIEKEKKDPEYKERLRQIDRDISRAIKPGGGMISGALARFERAVRQAKFERERAAAAAVIIAIGSFIASLVFLSVGITGNTIANLSRSDMNIISLVLFLVALVSSIIYSKYQDKKDRQ